MILKIHGAVNRADRNADSYVITEDDYIDFLSARARERHSRDAQRPHAEQRTSCSSATACATGTCG